MPPIQRFGIGQGLWRWQCDDFTRCDLQRGVDPGDTCLSWLHKALSWRASHRLNPHKSHSMRIVNQKSLYTHASCGKENGDMSLSCVVHCLQTSFTATQSCVGPRYHCAPVDRTSAVLQSSKMWRCCSIQTAYGVQISKIMMQTFREAPTVRWFHQPVCEPSTKSHALKRCVVLFSAWMQPKCDCVLQCIAYEL